MMSSETRTKGDEKVEFDYSKLRGKIKEICKTQDVYASKLGIGRVSLSQRLNNILDFSQNEIRLSCDILDIGTDEIPVYFFSLKVQKNEPHKKGVL